MLELADLDPPDELGTAKVDRPAATQRLGIARDDEGFIGPGVVDQLLAAD